MSADELSVNWNYPTPMRFGPGRIRELPDACRELGMSRPLLVTDRGLAKLPLVSEAVAINEAAGLPTGIFSEVRGNPTGEDVDAGVEVCRAGGHDGVVAFGGGSALDAAKAVALMVGQTRPLWDFEDVGDWWTRVDEAGMVPVVAVPTTSGTGSEVGRSSVIVDGAQHQKKIIFHPKMLPERVICDPALTVGMPPRLTGAVGMDALSHCLEAYCTDFYHPMADGIAVEGMRLVHRSLKKAFDDGEDLGARSDLMAAAAMGATAFQKGLGAMHSVAHAVGGHFDVHHGTTVAVMMPYVLRLNRERIEGKLARLAGFLELPAADFESVLEWVLELRRHVGIPHTLSELGISAGDVARLAPQAAADPTAGSNPVALTVPTVAALMDRAIAGDMG